MVEFRALVVVVVAACGFAPHAGDETVDGAQPGRDGSAVVVDAARDAAGSGSCGGMLWTADFGSDPTQQDLNGDGLPDWAMRDGSMFPVNQLVGGVWQAPGATSPLDTNPKQRFATRTLVHVRMRTPILAAGPTDGAVFWLNSGFSAGSDAFAVSFVSVNNDGSSQSVALYTKDGLGLPVAIASASELSATDFVEFRIDIDPVALTAHFVGEGQDTVAMLQQQHAGSDQWATVLGFSSAADFDLVEVEACAP